MRKTGVCGLALVVMACGGGGGGGGGSSGGGSSPTTPSNSAPSFTLASTISVEENTLFVAALSASDADGDDVTFSISGGIDRDHFTISDNELRITNPNFDLPVDADRNNIYEVRVTASDGSATTSQSVSVAVLNDKEGVDVDRHATGLPRVASAAFDGSTERMLLGTTEGQFLWIDASGTVTDLGMIAGFDGDLLGTALHNSVVMGDDIWALVRTASSLEVRKYDLSLLASGGAPETLWSLAYPAGSSDIDGGMFYSDDNMLFIATSDGGDGLAAQDEGDQRGKLLRVSLDDVLAASAAAPFVPTQMARGLHSPLPIGRRALLDRYDDGEELEIPATQVDIERPNYGWPYYRGDTRTSTSLSGSVADLVLPAALFARSGDWPVSAPITSAVYYDISGAFSGYVFGSSEGEIFELPLASGRGPDRITLPQNRTLDFEPDAGSIDGVTTMLYFQGWSGGNALAIFDEDGEMFLAGG